MAGRLILMKNSVDTIKGDCQAEGYTDWLKLDTLSFSAAAHIDGDGESGSVHQSSVVVTVPFGPWIAELQQTLFHGKVLGDVEFVELEQRVDAEKKKTWKKVREFKLIGGWLETMSHSWNAIHAGIEARFQYTDITFAWGDKVAHYNRTEAT